MTTTHSIDLNLTTAAESGLTSLPSLTPLTSTGLAGGDVRDVRVVSDIRPAVASDLVGRDVLDAPTAVAGEAFRRAMAEPIAENAALGEAFAAAVAATATKPVVGGDMRDVRVVSDVRPASPAVATDSPDSGVVGRDVLDAPTAKPAALIDGDVRDIRVVRDIRPAAPAVAADSLDSGVVGRDVLDAPASAVALKRDPPAPSVGRDVLDAPTAKPAALVDGDVRDVRVVSDVRPASPAVAADSLGSGVVGRDVLDAPLAVAGEAFRRAMAEPIAENAALGEAFAAAVDAPTASLATVAGGDVRDASGDSDVRMAPAVAGERERALAGGFAVASQPSLQTQSVFRRISRSYQTQATDLPAASSVGARVPARPQDVASVDLTQSRRATELGEASAAAAAPPTSLPSLTPLTSLGIAGERDARPYQAADAIAANIAANAAAAAAAAVATASTSATTPAPAAPSAPSAVLVQAAEAVADTLLVSPGLLRGQGEIVVQLRPDVLDGTEVRIAVTGRQLDVQFCPTTVDMAVMLENGRSQIASHLSAKIASFNVTVDVRKKKA